ncbi:peptidoglycan DD-metalloendopeptidase family protein [Candidatus Parcubacteria bacterium]|nr:peptidoglycan DD-metalloendopeptidase family protein [Candidatus Parcubacteria bacterium]
MNIKVGVLSMAVIIAILGSVAYVCFFNQEKISASKEASFNVVEPLEKIAKDRVEKILIIDGAIYGNLMATSGVEYVLAMEIYDAARDIYDLVKIRVGRVIELVYDRDTDELKELCYKIDSEDELRIKNLKYFHNIKTASGTLEKIDGWEARLEAIPYALKARIAKGVVKSSMYQAAMDNDIDIRAIIELANAFQWTIDFAMDPRVGDKFKLIYEERFLNGEYIMPGQIFAAVYINDGKEYYVYYFEENEDNKGFFDENGNSARKMFLKAPVEFKYISSGYTAGTRVIMELGIAGPHRAIDYAAPIGTPIRTVGNGTVIFTGWSSIGYGYLTSIRHNGTYTTNYAHQSKIAVERGQKVKQGDIIGYVGSTGLSTGPHLHYEMVKNGAKINPLKEILPPGKPIKNENKKRFFENIKDLRDKLAF